MSLTLPRISAVALLAVLPFADVGRAQAPQTPPVFRGEANLVEVIVRVTDAKGQFISDLTQADFALEEEGRAQTIVAFNRVDLPRAPVPTIEAARPVLRAPVGSTVATNVGLTDPRIFVLLLDDMLTSPMASLPARQAAREFVERYVGPTDLVAAFSTGGRGVQTQEFTTDKTRVLATIDRFIGRRCRYQKISGFYLPVETEADKIYSIRVATDMIKALAGHLNNVRGRRVTLLWISEGIDYTVQNLAISGNVGGTNEPDPATVMHAMQDAIDVLQRANVTLYAIDPRRLYSPEQLQPEVPPPGMAPETVANPLCREANREELSRSLDTLREFATKTGGFAAVNTNDFSGAFDRVLDDNSQYYVLGYQPNRPGRDGQIRRIRVRVTRPGSERALVSARSSYTFSSPQPSAPAPPGTGPAIAAALNSSLPTLGLPLRVQAIPRRGTNGRGLVYVIVEAAGNDVQFTEKDGRFTERIEFGLLTADRLARQGNVQPVAMDLNLTAAQVAQFPNRGLRWLTTLDLEPGHYSLRVAGHLVGSKRTGAIFLDIDVPKFEDDDLRIDGVALTSLPAALAVTAGTSPVALGLPGPPTTARTFVVGDVITLSAEVSTRRDFTQGALELTVKSQQAADAAGPVLLQQTLALADRASATQPHAWAVDTKTLGVGQYVLRLAIRDARGRSADTAVLFEVVDR